MLSGYKTYILCACAVIYAVSGFFTGHFDANTAVSMIWVALTGAALRNGVANS